MIKPVSNYNFYPKYSTSRNKVSFGQLNRIDFDVFESSSKPIEKKSQISKLIENTRLKFTISKIYDDLYEDMKKECDEKGINFVKPNLIFDKTDSSVDAALITGRNAIVFNTKYLGLDRFVKYKDGTIPFSRLDDDLEFPIVSFDADNISENQRYLKANEYLLEKASILRHELAHARQEQIMLSTNGGVEKFLEILKSLE